MSTLLGLTDVNVLAMSSKVLFFVSGTKNMMKSTNSTSSTTNTMNVYSFNAIYNSTTQFSLV